MENLVNNFFRGIVAWAIIAGIHGLTLILGQEAASVSEKGSMSSHAYTRMLTK